MYLRKLVGKGDGWLSLWIEEEQQRTRRRGSRE
jgi:hypothetical protein